MQGYTLVCGEVSPHVIARCLRASLWRHTRGSRLHDVSVRSFSSHLPLRQGDRQSSASALRKDYQKRVDQLRVIGPETQWYPRLPAPRLGEHRFTATEARLRARSVEAGSESLSETMTVTGRVSRVREAGSKLFFIDFRDESRQTLQIVLNSAKLEVEPAEFRKRCRAIRRGDILSATGALMIQPGSSPPTASLFPATLPQVVAPSLHQIPDKLDDAETRARLRYLDMLVNPAAIATIKLRAEIERSMHQFFNMHRFTCVHTPILEANAGGAVARPFQTEATELSGQPLHLRIAPELWLKRLVVGGLDKVYEIGPSFRNEGVDGTHNPEFYTCEFYRAYATLDELMAMTEELFLFLAEHVHAQASADQILSIPDQSIFQQDYPRLEFIPALEKALSQSLPDLSSPTAQEDLTSLLRTESIPLPSYPTLPRLLDALSAHYLEPLTADQPTFITHHPAIMSPLSKHFVCEQTGQTVAARAELFFQGREYANMYEEENSPFEQRAKFELQAQQHLMASANKTSPETSQSATEAAKEDADHPSKEAGASVDENYLRALEYGLPPTGGWGCGVDRLVMLFSGHQRIADVLPFGTIRNVVGLGRKTKSEA